MEFYRTVINSKDLESTLPDLPDYLKNKRVELIILPMEAKGASEISLLEDPIHDPEVLLRRISKQKKL